jgi:hypothetical protein
MQRTDLIRQLEKDVVSSFGTAGITMSQAIPRHREVSEFLAKHILKKLAN